MAWQLGKGWLAILYLCRPYVLTAGDPRDNYPSYVESEFYSNGGGGGVAADRSMVRRCM